MVNVELVKRYGHIRNEYKDAIIIHPIMRGGIVPEDTQKRLSEEGWTEVGYSVCFNCLKGKSGTISKPPVAEFLVDVANFFGGDRAEHTLGCRAAQFAVMKAIKDFVDSLKDYTRIVLTDPLCHYTTVIAAELAGLQIAEAPHNGSPEYKVKAEGFQVKIEEIRKETGKLPGLIAITHAEPYHGNLNPVEEVGKLAKEYNIPFMVNAAYTAGVMPVYLRNLQADFLTVSAHKSMASLGPLGFLVTGREWAEGAFATSKIQTPWTNRTWKIKIPSIFGCSIGGIPLISAMYSFAYVVDRVENWDEELKKMQWFIQEMERIESIKQVGDNPHKHHLMHFQTPIFWEISQHHKRQGFFLTEEMIKKGVVGLQRGLSKNIKLSLYGLGWDEVKKVRDAFHEITEKYIKEFKIDYSIS